MSTDREYANPVAEDEDETCPICGAVVVPGCDCDVCGGEEEAIRRADEEVDR